MAVANEPRVIVANEPRVIVADEPVTGLDVVTQARIMKLLHDLRERLGLAVLLISHDLPLVARTADELLVMQSGRIVEAGPADVVASQPHHPHTRALLAASGPEFGSTAPPPLRGRR